MAWSQGMKNRTHPTDDGLNNWYMPINMLLHEGAKAYEYHSASYAEAYPIWKQGIDMFLTPDELIELTERKRRDAQVKVLRHMGIQHKIRPNGSLAVLKSHIEKQFDGREDDVIVSKRIEPNWAAV